MFSSLLQHFNSQMLLISWAYFTCISEGSIAKGNVLKGFVFFLGKFVNEAAKYAQEEHKN